MLCATRPFPTGENSVMAQAAGHLVVRKVKVELKVGFICVDLSWSADSGRGACVYSMAA